MVQWVLFTRFGAQPSMFTMASWSPRFRSQKPSAKSHRPGILGQESLARLSQDFSASNAQTNINPKLFGVVLESLFMLSPSRFLEINPEEGRAPPGVTTEVEHSIGNLEIVGQTPYEAIVIPGNQLMRLPSFRRFLVSQNKNNKFSIYSRHTNLC